MNGLKQQYSDRVEFVMLDFDDRSLDEERAKYSITDRSQYVLVDADDNIVHRWYGFISAAEVEQVIDALLASG